MRRLLLVLALVGCGGSTVGRSTTTLRPGCAPDQFWSNNACKPRGDVTTHLAAGKQALADADVERATTALDAVANAKPLAYDANVQLWKQRGIAAAYSDDDAGARRAFRVLLSLDPAHFLSYLESPKATKTFEEVRTETQRLGAPELEVNWAHGQKVGASVPVDITVVSDPTAFLATATLFVRERGDATWRAADIALGGPTKDHHLVLPPVRATKPVSLELYLRAYDKDGNEVLTWADPRQPREIPLRFDPERPWWQRWWAVTIAAGVAVAATGVIVYAATREPPDRIDGSAVVR